MKNDMMSFMNEFIDSGETEVNEELFELEQKYSQMYGHGVPREMLPPSINDEQIKEAVFKCIESGKDNLFELLNVVIEDNQIY